MQLERQPVLTSHVLKRIGRHLLHTPRAVWEFLLHTEERIVTIDVLDIWRVFARRSTHLGNLVVDTESCVNEQRGIRVPQHGTLCE